jgi:NAD(P) transhydrogenase subunit alpha
MDFRAHFSYTEVIVMMIGVPKEILEEEKRVAALPETVKRYVAMGFKVLVEASAGAGVFRSDQEYAAAGAEIVPSAQAIFDRADIVLKVKQPCLNKAIGKHEAEMLRSGTTLITFLHPAAPPNHPTIRTLRDRNITAFTMDGIPRITRAQTMDALTSMSTVTGYRSMLIAANHFPRFIPMIGTAIGAVLPAQILVIGAGVVGLQAVATAKRLGGVVKAVDIRAEARQEAASLKGTQVVGFVMPEDLAHGEGGYAKALSADWLEREREMLRPIVAHADIVILSALVPGDVAPMLISRDMVMSMRAGSVIVDVSIDQGGNCEVTTPGRETFVHDVFVCGTANIPGSMAVDATWLYAHNMLHYVENLFKDGIERMNMDDEIVRHSLVTTGGKILHAGALKAMGLAV